MCGKKSSYLNSAGTECVVLGWFGICRSHLSSRYQCVAINKIHSKAKRVSCGVPQGSVMDLLLLLIFISDSSNSSQHFHFTILADDSILTCRVPDASTHSIITSIESKLQNVSGLVDSNILVISSKKSNLIIFSHRKQIDLPYLKFGCELITRTEDIKFLGLCIE